MTETTANALILVVDDDVLERMGASAMFEDAGYRVLEADNADEAMRCCEANADIGLLFTDVSMPGSMDGSDLARQLVARWPNIGIIMVSGRSRPDRLPSRLQFHSKPYQPSDVLQQAKAMTS